MSINYNGNNVSSVVYNGNDVNEVIYDGNVVWRRQFNILYTLNNGSHYNNSYASTYLFYTTSQSVSLGRFTRSGYDVSSVTTTAGTISGDNTNGYTLTIPANQTGNITISVSWVVTTATLTFIEDSGASYGSWQYSSLVLEKGTILKMGISNSSAQGGVSKAYIYKNSISPSNIINTYTCLSNPSALSYYTITAGTNFLTSATQSYEVVENANIGVNVSHTGLTPTLSKPQISYNSSSDVISVTNPSGNPSVSADIELEFEDSGGEYVLLTYTPTIASGGTWSVQLDQDPSWLRVTVVFDASGYNSSSQTYTW